MTSTDARTSHDPSTALVTGAARGMGAAIAQALFTRGAHVLLADIDADAVQARARHLDPTGHRTRAIALDVRDADACALLPRQLPGDWPALSVLVNNAGILMRVAHDAPDADRAWHDTFAVNVQGTYDVTRAVLPLLKASRGCIVNVASIHAYAAPGVSAAYSASKGAVAQFTKAMAVELGAHGVRVNAVAPGIIDTAMTAGTLADPQRSAAFLRHVPLGRAGRDHEVAAVVSFLASPDASYVNGVVLPVDGGYLCI